MEKKKLNLPLIIAGIVVLVIVILTIGLLLKPKDAKVKEPKEEVKSELMIELENYANELKEGLQSFRKETTLGETFTFDHVVLKFDENYEILVVEDEESKYNGDEVVKIPVTLLNIGEKEIAFPAMVMPYNLDGTSGSAIYQEQFKDSANFMEKMQPGKLGETFVYMPYQGDGAYSIKLTDMLTSVNIKFDIVK